MSDNIERLRKLLDEMEPLDLSLSQITAIVDHISVGLIVADESGTITWINKQAREILGYAFEEIVGKSITTIVPERLRMKHTEAFVRRIGMKPEEEHARRELLLETEALTASGKEVHVQVALSSHTHNGGPRVFTAAIRKL